VNFSAINGGGAINGAAGTITLPFPRIFASVALEGTTPIGQTRRAVAIPSGTAYDLMASSVLIAGSAPAGQSWHSVAIPSGTPYDLTASSVAIGVGVLDRTVIRSVEV
jgi:hypothetical protein